MDDVAKLKDRAAKAWSKGNWAAAREAYDDLYKAEPRNLMHRLRVGDALVKLSKNADAIAVYAEVAEKYAAEGLLIRAISVNKLILQLDPTQKDTQKRLAALYSKRGVATAAARAAGINAAAPKGGELDLPAAEPDEMQVQSGLAPEAAAPSSKAIDAPAAAPATMVIESGGRERTVGAPEPPLAPAAAATSAPTTVPATAAAPGAPAMTGPLSTPAGAPHAPPPAASAWATGGPAGPAPAAGTALPWSHASAAGGPVIAGIGTGGPFPSFPSFDAAAPASPAGAMSPPPAKVTAAQALAAEIIELGPQDLVTVAAPQTVAQAVEMAREELKAAGNDVDSLFSDVGDVPQVPPTPLFSDLQPAEFERVIELLSPIRVPQNTTICREGEPATSMFVIAQGSVSVYFTDRNGRDIQLARLGDGDFFGEFALFEGGVRNASVMALEETELLELSKADFDRVVAEFPAVAQVLRMFYYARLADTFLAKSPLFGTLPREARWEFVRRMALQRYHAGQPVLREGDSGDALYMIRAGTVRIFAASSGGPQGVAEAARKPDGRTDSLVPLADLPSGEIFGEIAVIHLQPRVATVVALTDVELYRLEAAATIKLLQDNPEVGRRVAAIAEVRRRSTSEAMTSRKPAGNPLR